MRPARHATPLHQTGLAGFTRSAVPVASGLIELGEQLGELGDLARARDGETVEEKRARTDAAVRTGGAITGSAATATIAILVAAGAVAPPISTAIAAGAGVVIASTVAIVGAVRARETKLLTGDKRAIRAFIKAAARWPTEKRRREAKRLSELYLKHKKAGKKKAFLSKKRVNQTEAWKVREAELRMKLQVLIALEAEARKDRKRPLVAGDARTAPEVADQQPDDQAPTSDVVAVPWHQNPLALGAAGVAMLVLIGIARRRGSSARTP